MICSRLSKFPNLPIVAHIELFRYALGLARQLWIKHYAGIYHVPELMEIKFFVDHSYYSLSSLWRAALLVTLGHSIEKSSAIFSVSPQDVWFIFDECRIEKNKLMGRKQELDRVFNKEDLWKILETELLGYIKFMVDRKLRFVYNSNNLEAEDFIHDSILCALRYLYRNDWKEKDALVAGAKRTVSNFINNTIKYFNALKRRRLESCKDGWENTVIDIDKCYPVSSPNGFNSGQDLLGHLKNNCNSKQMQFVELVTDSKIDWEFESALKREPRTFSGFVKSCENFVGFTPIDKQGIKQSLSSYFEGAS